jgi:hypothetical protein
MIMDLILPSMLSSPDHKISDINGRIFKSLLWRIAYLNARLLKPGLNSVAHCFLIMHCKKNHMVYNNRIDRVIGIITNLGDYHEYAEFFKPV